MRTVPSGKAAIALLALTLLSACGSAEGASSGDETTPTTRSPGSSTPALETTIRPSGWVAVTGSFTDCDWADVGRSLPPGTFEDRLRDEVGTCPLEMSDPRVDGEEVLTLNWDYRSDRTSRMWGTTVIRNDGGTWKGAWTGLMMPDTSEEYFAVYDGTGAYDGLRYHALGWHEAFGTPWTVTGWIEPLS